MTVATFSKLQAVTSTVYAMCTAVYDCWCQGQICSGAGSDLPGSYHMADCCAWHMHSRQWLVGCWADVGEMQAISEQNPWHHVQYDSLKVTDQFSIDR